MNNLVLKQLLTFLDRSNPKITYTLKCKDLVDKEMSYVLVVHPRTTESKILVKSVKGTFFVEAEYNSVDGFVLDNIQPTELIEEMYTQSGSLRSSNVTYFNKELHLFLYLFQYTKLAKVCVVKHDHDIMHCVFLAGRVFYCKIDGNNFILVERAQASLLRDFSRAQVVAMTTMPRTTPSQFIETQRKRAVEMGLNFMLDNGGSVC